MRLEKLTIALKNEYAPIGPSNPYEAKLSVSYDDNRMHVKLSPESALRIIELAGEEIAAAAQIQIRDFIREALTASRTPMLEGVAQ